MLNPLSKGLINGARVLVVFTLSALAITSQPIGHVEAQTSSTSAQTRVMYEVAYTPTGFSWFDELVQKNSILFQLRNKPPRSLAGLRRRVKRDKLLLADLLKSEGFYAGEVEAIQNRGSRIGQAIVVKLNPGPVFKTKKYLIVYDQNIAESEKTNLQEIANQNFKRLGRASAKNILATEQALLLYLSNNGYPFAEATNRIVTVDHADNSVSTKLNIALGPQSTFGTTLFSGLKTVDANFLLSRMKITQGDTYSQAELDAAKKRLLNTGLFTNVNIRIPKDAPSFGSVPLTVEVRERPKRQVSLSAGASIKDGPKASIEWRHRDLFGKAQNLIVKLEGDKNKAKATTTFEWPDFFRDDRLLTSSVSAEYNGTDGLENTNLSANVKVSRFYDRKRTFASVGAEVEYIRSSGNVELWLASLPVEVDFNRTDSLLNPGKGFRFFADLTPYLNLENANQAFLKSEFGVSTYTPILDDNKLTVGTWTKVGAILGEDLNDIPNSKRFFIGGSGSLRAFPNEGVSASGFIGALGKLEGGIELRTRFNASYGAVAFVEGGRVFASLDDNLKSDWKAGAGLGFRYFTAFGPVRVDIAVPISEQPDFDDVQFQVGLGQAF